MMFLKVIACKIARRAICFAAANGAEFFCAWGGARTWGPKQLEEFGDYDRQFIDKAKTIFPHVFWHICGRNLPQAMQRLADLDGIQAVQYDMPYYTQNLSWREWCDALSIERFRTAAAICREAGFDGVEPHGAHGFLLNQFFSPRHNHRTDAYGGDLPGRMRLGLEVVSAVREAVGERMLLLYRHTPKQRDSYTVEESLEFARKLVERGLDVLDVSPASEDAPADLAEPFKRTLPVPVIAVNDMDVHDRAVEALTKGRADLIAIGRGLIADPFWADKTRAGRTDDIIVCEKCNKGCFGNLRKGLPIECVQHQQAA